MFSQPYAAGGTDSAGPTAGGSDVLVSMAATLAIKDGNADAIRAQLPPQHHAAFDLALTVQQMRGGDEDGRRLTARTQDEVEKRRAARTAADLLQAEEKAALYAAADADGDTFAVLSPMELDQLPEAETLVDGFLVKESVVRLYGPPKSYKSFVMLDLAACVGAGIEWHGKRVAQSRVLYVVAEGVRGIKRRVRAWEAVNKRAMVGVDFYERAVQLGDRKDVSKLIRTAKRGGYEFVILDTQARCTVGLEENSASEMGVVVAALDVLKEVTGACVALVHHSGASGGRARGSTAILGALDAELEVEADKDSMTVSVHTRAQKDLAEASSIEFDLVSPPDGQSLAIRARRQWYQTRPEDLSPLHPEAMDALRAVDSFGIAGATTATVAKAVALESTKVAQGLAAMHRKGILKYRSERWFLDKAGRIYLSGTLDSVRED